MAALTTFTTPDLKTVRALLHWYFFISFIYWNQLHFLKAKFAATHSSTLSVDKGKAKFPIVAGASSI